MIKHFARTRTGGVAGHSRDGGVGHSLKAFLFPPETKGSRIAGEWEKNIRSSTISDGRP